MRATGRDMQLTRQTGEHLVAAELGRRGYVATPFAGNIPMYVLLIADLHGRAVAQCKAGDVDLNGEMVRLGWALAYPCHSFDDVSEEAEARAAKRGLWQGRFENPQAWRERHRGQPVRGDAGMDGAVGED